MGYAGKQIIHPDQIAPVQAAYSPSAKRIAYAEGVLAAYELAETEVKTGDLPPLGTAHPPVQGKGAFTYEDQMIDKPTIKQCQNVLAMVKLQAGDGAEAVAEDDHDKADKADKPDADGKPEL